MTEDEINRLFALLPAATNVIGFYDLIYEMDDKTGLSTVRRMMNEAHFATSAHHLAREIYAILRSISDRTQD